MTTLFDDGQGKVIHGDCITVMAEMEAESIDAVVCDPPYDLVSGSGGGFMNKSWDSTGVAFDPDTWRQVFRVLKPGGHLLAFGGTRTYHRMACAIEDAGLEIRDSIVHFGGGDAHILPPTLHWVYGSG